MLVLEDRGPGRPSTAGPPAEALPAAPAAKPIRIGSARCSAAQQELASQLAELEPVGKRIFSKKISNKERSAHRITESVPALPKARHRSLRAPRHRIR
ncbi:hypothetical protein ACGFNX_30310 [Streptomyces sp. NPDC048723]|uniref:hypothetical protein n=1 Tax=Streptomyces sp. NPDC048723 TaxID=3365589 RepID=UPI00371A20E2